MQAADSAPAQSTPRPARAPAIRPARVGCPAAGRHPDRPGPVQAAVRWPTDAGARPAALAAAVPGAESPSAPTSCPNIPAPAALRRPGVVMPPRPDQSRQSLRRWHREAEPCSGQHQAAALARKQRGAQCLFQRTHMPTDGAMGDVRFLGSTADALQARGSFERAQRRQRGSEAFICDSRSQVAAILSIYPMPRLR